MTNGTKTPNPYTGAFAVTASANMANDRNVRQINIAAMTLNVAITLFINFLKVIIDSFFCLKCAIYYQ